MSWAAVVSGKARHAGTIAPVPPASAPPVEPVQFPTPSSQPVPDPTPPRENHSRPTAQSRGRSQQNRPTQSNGAPSPPSPRTSTQRKSASQRRHKHPHQEIRSPTDAMPRSAANQHKHKSASGQSIWDDPRIVAIYRLWTQHISSFMAQPVPFFHFFVMNPQFRQSVFDAGLTFHPDTDPNNPVLINLNSTRFGMAERINALSPPAGTEARPNLVLPAGDVGTPPPLKLAPDLDPSAPLQHPVFPHNSTIPFLSPNVRDLFEAAKATEANGSGGEATVQPSVHLTSDLGSQSLKDMRGHDPRTSPVDEALARRFAEGIRFDVSDSESERLSESDHVVMNGSRLHHYPFSVSNMARNSHLPPAERRRLGRRRVVLRMMDIQIPPNPICKQLSDRAEAELVQQIEDTFPRITPISDSEDLKEDLLVRLRRVIAGEWEGAGIDVYGSAGNGLGLRSADVDMSLYMPPHVAALHGLEQSETNPAKMILARLATIMEENDMSVLSKVLEARVPVIKMMDPLSELQIDICVNNNLAVRNTKLLKAYVDLDERFRYVCILVKLWAKRRDLNDAYYGTLSSYAYTLLVIHYLQTLKPPVLPCLQQMVNGKRAPRGTKLPTEMTDNGTQKLYNTYYDRTVSPETFQSANHTPVHELLLGFFKYYAYRFKYRTDLVSIRLGTKVSRATRGWDEQSVYREWEEKQAVYRDALEAAKGAVEARKRVDAGIAVPEEGRANGKGAENGRAEVHDGRQERIEFPRKPRLESKHLFCIEDPFDIDHDLSRGMEKHAVTVIRQEMMRAYELLAETGDLEEACEEFL